MGYRLSAPAGSPCPPSASAATPSAPASTPSTPAPSSTPRSTTASAFFDTADTYGFGASEELLGKALGRRRDDVVVATKFGMDMEGRNGPGWGAGVASLRPRAVEASLRRLGTDHIDLYQLHQPDLVTPIEETLEAMTELVDEGKVRYLGCSNFAAWEVVDAHWTARSAGLRPFVTAQNEYSLYNRAAEEELVPALERLGMSLLPYFPLAYGLLTGKYRRGEDAPEGSRLSADGPGAPARRRRLRPGRGARGRSPPTAASRLLDVALGGLAAQPAGRQRDRRRHPAGAGRRPTCRGLWQPTDGGPEALAGDQHRSRGGDDTRVVHPALRRLAFPAGAPGPWRISPSVPSRGPAVALHPADSACGEGWLARPSDLGGGTERRSGGGLTRPPRPGGSSPATRVTSHQRRSTHDPITFDRGLGTAIGLGDPADCTRQVR